LTEIGPITAGVVALQTSSQVLALHTTGSGVTVTGAELKVPVAASCTVPFFTAAGSGLIEIDSSTRLLPPQLVNANPNKRMGIIQRPVLRRGIHFIFDPLSLPFPDFPQRSPEQASCQFQRSI
jgi:hypothetical protein